MYDLPNHDNVALIVTFFHYIHHELLLLLQYVHDRMINQHDNYLFVQQDDG
jgi:hypothetical protein